MQRISKIKNDYKQYVPCTLCILCLVGTFLILLLVPLSYSRVHYYELGLIKSRSTGTVDRNIVYGNGNHLIGPDNYFLIYPATIQSNDLKKLSIWSLSSNEDAGIFLEIDISFQYKIIKNSLGQLYNKIGINYHNLVTSLAISAIKNEAVKWSADQYLFNRKTIENYMLIEVTKILFEGSDCNVTSLQLRDVIFPVLFYDRKLDSAIQMQKNIAEAYNSSANIIRGETSQIVQYINNRGVQVVRSADSQSVNIKELANTQAKKMLQDVKITGLTMIKKALGITNITHLLSLDYMLQLEQSKDGIDYLINFDKTAKIIN